MFKLFGRKTGEISKLKEENRYLKIENLVLKERSRILEEENDELKSKIAQYLMAAKLEGKETRESRG